MATHKRVCHEDYVL